MLSDYWLTEIDFFWLFYLGIYGPKTREELLQARKDATGRPSYNKLPRLESLGLVEKCDPEAFEWRGFQKHFKLTPAGREALKQ